MSHLPGDRTAFCAVDGQAVCLDIRRDRYFLLRNDANSALVSLAQGKALDAAEKDALVSLEQRGVLRGVLDAPSDCHCPWVTESILDDTSADASWRHYVQWMGVTWRARKRLGRGLEAALVEAHKYRVPPIAPVDWSLIRRVSTLHYRTGPVAWRHDCCLPRSLALYFHLALLGQSARLVIGVALQPFRAHCWAQKGGVVLNDSADAVRAFKPIFAI